MIQQVRRAGPGVNAIRVVDDLLIPQGGFTRASPAFNPATGQMVATDVPRLINIPLPSGSFKMILCERDATNNLLYSNAFPTAPWSNTLLSAPVQTVTDNWYNANTAWAITEPLGYSNMCALPEALNSWTTKTATTIVSDVIANPLDGYVNADNIQETNATSAHDIRLVFTKPAAVSNTYNFSGYFKAAERDQIRITLFGTSTSNQGWASFDLTSGLVLTTGVAGAGFTVVSSAIASMGSGWYRCSAVITTNADSTVGQSLAMQLAGAVSYAGTTGFGLYAWGIQLVLGSSLPTYANGSFELVQNFARVATALTENFSFSVYIKPGNGGRRITLRMCDVTNLNGITLIYNPDTGTITFNNTAIGTGWAIVFVNKIRNVSNGWVRVTVSGRCPAALTTFRCRIIMTLPATSINYSGDGRSTVFIHRAQCESSSLGQTIAINSSSYIPTTTVAVFRAFDSTPVLYTNTSVNQEVSVVFIYLNISTLNCRAWRDDQAFSGANTNAGISFTLSTTSSQTQVSATDTSGTYNSPAPALTGLSTTNVQCYVLSGSVALGTCYHYVNGALLDSVATGNVPLVVSNHWVISGQSSAAESNCLDHWVAVFLHLQPQSDAERANNQDTWRKAVIAAPDALYLNVV